MPDLAHLAHADRLAASAIPPLRRDGALATTLLELRALLLVARHPVRHRLLDLGIKAAVAVTGAVAGAALRPVPWAAIPAGVAMAGALFLLKRRPFPLRLPGAPPAAADAAAAVEAIGPVLARAAASGGDLAHVTACHARAWDLLHDGVRHPYTPGQAAWYGRLPYNDLSPGWTASIGAHVLVHDLWRAALHDPAARRRLARADHALRYLSPVPRPWHEAAVRTACGLMPLAVAVLLGPLWSAIAVITVLTLALALSLTPCPGHPPTRPGIRAIDPEALRRVLAGCEDPLVRELTR